MAKSFPNKEQTFKKGQSGNPKGRPRKLPDLDHLLAEVLGDEKDGRTATEAILMKLRSMAVSGNIRAAEVLLDRAHGKAKQSMDMTTDGKSLPVPIIQMLPPDE